ncbi:hypothetical protein J6590_064871 [Homalodisca vitripennis]|nr:hypothetical protein J6590_064871 [Homalodisca vitripennis]
MSLNLHTMSTPGSALASWYFSRYLASVPRGMRTNYALRQDTTGREDTFPRGETRKNYQRSTTSAPASPNLANFQDVISPRLASLNSPVFAQLSPCPLFSLYPGIIFRSVGPGTITTVSPGK